LLAAAAATPQMGFFRYERPIESLPAASGQTRLPLDAGVFSHAAPGLADLRLYQDSTETPFAIHLAAPVEGAEKTIAPLNLGKRAGQTVFDAAMPDGPYGDLKLAVGAQNFIATVAVSGSQAEAGAAETKIGSYTIFDLTRQKLGRSVILHLPDSDFRYLHFRIAGPIQPANVTGLTVGRLPGGDPKYVTVAQSATVTQKGRTSVVEFTVPANVPVDRIVFSPAPEPVNFSRDVTVSIVPVLQRSESDGSDGPDRSDGALGQPSASAFGNLLRLHSVQDGHRIEEEHLVIDAPGTELNTAAKWRVAIENGDDRPIEFTSVQLQMVERSVCFDSVAGARYSLYYGDPALNAPRYDYAALFSFSRNSGIAAAGDELENPAYRPRPDERPFTEKHPALLWVALIAVIALLGAIALRSAKSAAPPS
jgi:hypothetical protein